MRLLSRAVLRHATGRSLIFVLLLSSSAVAQQSVGAISGTVRDSAGAPVASVEVRGGKVTVWTRTDSAGVYHLGGLVTGKAELHFRRLGYEPKVQQVQVSEGVQTLDVVMDELPQELAALVTEAATRVREMLRDFWNRRDQGNGGHFITRADIEERRPINLSDMFRVMPGMQLLPQRFGGASTLRFARNTGARDCPPQYYIDGVMARGFNIDDMPPGDVEGIEIYPGVSTIPPQFKSIASTSNCGVVVIWSRVPGT